MIIVKLRFKKKKSIAYKTNENADSRAPLLEILI